MMGKVILDEEDYSITISGEKKDFTLTEFKLLHYFMKRKGRVQTRDNLLLGYGNSIRMWKHEQWMCIFGGSGKRSKNQA